MRDGALVASGNAGVMATGFVSHGVVVCVPWRNVTTSAEVVPVTTMSKPQIRTLALPAGTVVTATVDAATTFALKNEAPQYIGPCTCASALLPNSAKTATRNPKINCFMFVSDLISAGFDHARLTLSWLAAKDAVTFAGMDCCCT